MTATSEFSRFISVEGLTPDKVRHENVEAIPEECDALANRFRLRKLSYLKSKLTVRRVAGGTVIRVAGTIEADVIQACVISLQDVPEEIRTDFETFFTEDQARIDEDDDDAPEMITNGQIDLGEVVAQYLSLALDPYPRAPGVNLAAQMASVGLKEKANPFDVLKKIQDETGKKGT